MAPAAPRLPVAIKATAAVQVVATTRQVSAF